MTGSPPVCEHLRKRTSKRCWSCEVAYRASRRRQCGALSCTEKAIAKGWCMAHYHMVRRYGDANAEKQYVRGDAAFRFWRKVEQEGPLVLDTPCWLWTGGISDTGYGIFNDGKRLLSAHRMSYILERGAIPDGLTIDHLCRTRSCVNPEHLEAVTQAVNNSRIDRTVCRRGHDMSNAYVRPDTGMRMCRDCIRQRAKRRKDARVRISRSVRESLLATAGYRCAYGGCSNARSIDHIVPRADRLRAGISDTDERYLVVACLTHNVLKGSRHLVPPSWAHLVDELNEVVGGAEWRVWNGGVDEPAFREVHR